MPTPMTSLFLLVVLCVLRGHVLLVLAGVLQDGFVDKRFKKIIDRLIQIQQQGSFGPCVECDRRSDVDTAPVWPRNALVSALYKLRNTIPLTAVVQHIIIANSDWNSKVSHALALVHMLTTI